MVGRGARVLIRKFGLIVGREVGVGAGAVAVREAGSMIVWERIGSWAETKKLVAFGGIGWKGVGVGEAFGGTVT
jgi:hypothetical protein